MAVAGTIVVTAADVGNGYTEYSCVWTSDASGNVTGNAVPVKRGFLTRAKFIPGASTSQPTDQYDMTIADADGVDVLGGTGSNLSNANPAVFVPVFGDGTNKSQRLFLNEGGLIPVIANAGNAKSGTIKLLIGP